MSIEFIESEIKVYDVFIGEVKNCCRHVTLIGPKQTTTNAKLCIRVFINQFFEITILIIHKIHAGITVCFYTVAGRFAVQCVYNMQTFFFILFIFFC